MCNNQINRIFAVMKMLYTMLAAMMMCGCNTSATSANLSDAICDSLANNESEPLSKEEMSDTLSFAFVGDVMMGTTFPDSVSGSHLPAYDGRKLFDASKEVISRVDLAGLNLEGSFLTGPGKRRPVTNPNTYYIFRMPPSYVTNLVTAGFDWVGIANNHINDFGEPGRESTMQTVRNAGLAVVGLKGRCETAQFVRKGRRIGVTQFGHGDNNLDVNSLEELRRVVSALHENNDIVVVSFHGGAEGKDKTRVPFAPEVYVGENRGDVAAFAHAAIDAGADVVFGHGPHVPRGVELYRDRIIFYSLGNFCTPYRISKAGPCGYAPIAEVFTDGAGRFLHGKVHSLLQRVGAGPVKDKKQSAAILMRRMTELDFPTTNISIGMEGIITRH